MTRVLFLVLTLWLFLTACNPVAWNAKRTQRKLENRNIESRYLKTDSLTIHYWMGGEGPVIVLIHGFGGDASVTWKKEMRALAKDHRVIAADLLWFGESEAKLKPTLVNQRKALIQLLKTEQCDTIQLIGQSYGGFLAVDLALNGPFTISKMMIANSPGPTFDQQRLRGVMNRYHVDSIHQLFVLQDPDGIQRLVDASTFKDRKVPRFLKKALFAQYFEQNREALKALMLDLQASTLATNPLEPLIEIPTEVLWGEQDEIFPLDEGKKFAQAIHASWFVIPECGHAPQLDKPKIFLDEVVRFFATSSGSRV